MKKNLASLANDVSKVATISEIPKEKSASPALIGLVIGIISLSLIVIVTTLVCLKRKRESQEPGIHLKET